LSSRLSYTFSNGSGLARKRSNFYFPNSFRFFYEGFSSFVFLISFTSNRFTNVTFSSNWRCFKTCWCFFYNRQIVFWFCIFTNWWFLRSWTIWILKLTWVKLDISIELRRWNWHNPIFVRHVFIRWVFGILEQMVAWSSTS
jgi:hypothetical protein